MSFLDEMKRRNVFRVGAAYLVTAWLIVQVVETIFPIYDLPEFLIRTIITLLGIGVLPVLVLAWVFELTPEGIKKDHDVDRSKSPTVETRKHLDRIIIVMLTLALAYFAFDRFVLVPERTAEQIEDARKAGQSKALVEPQGEPSIAVLAFEDRSPEHDQEYLSAGIADEILTLLANVPDLRVISRSSAFYYKDKNLPIPTIAEQLNVSYVLEGSVRTAGNQVRVSVQLVDARNDTPLWSQTFNGELDDVFDIQEEVATGIVGKLELTMRTKVSKRSRVESDAYYLYLQAKYYKDQFNTGDAIRLLEQVVIIEPGFADAWADLARLYIETAPSLGSLDHSGDPMWQKALEAIDRLSEVDQGHPMLAIVSAWRAIESKSAYSDAARLLERAIQQHPGNEFLYQVASVFAALIGDDPLAIALSKKVVDLNPLCAQCTYRHSRQLINSGRYQDAEEAILRYRDIVPGSGGELTLGIARLLGGDIAGAVAAFNQRGDKAGQAYGSLLVQLTLDPNAGVLMQINEFAQENNYLNPFAASELYALAGQTDRAFQTLQIAANSYTNWIIARHLRSPFLTNLRSDPRWTPLMETVGIAPHQLKDVQFSPELR